ncbi:MAG: hypothetical protein M0025_04430 [Elusimicrobia bacterium]|nr:hypothetical protein [Elusimicrobiota bacterium]
MKKTYLLTAAVLVSLSAGAFASGQSFEQSVEDVVSSVRELKAPPPGGFHPGGPGHDPAGPGHITPPVVPHPQPGPWHDNPGHNNPGGHGGDWDHHGGDWDHHGNDWDHHGNDWDHHGNDWDHHGNDWDHHPYQPPYHGPVYECTDWTFNADTPNPYSNKIYYYDAAGRIYSQKVTINIAPRDLKPWETETISVCPGRLDLDKSLFYYNVSQKDNSGFGSFFTGEKSYLYTLVPTGRKVSTPDGQGLAMLSGGLDQAGRVYITIADKWAAFYPGQRVDFFVKVMRIPSNVQGLSAQELIDALKETQFSASFMVAPQYTLQLFDRALPGMYTVTVSYVRNGQSMSQLFTFSI